MSDEKKKTSDTPFRESTEKTEKLRRDYSESQRPKDGVVIITDNFKVPKPDQDTGNKKK